MTYGRFAHKNHVHSVYVYRCEDQKFYVGMTPTWKLESRWNDHTCEDAKWGSRWTNLYKPTSRVKYFHMLSFQRACWLEQQCVEKIMSVFGLDSVRGGKWNMTTMGDTWWVPERLRKIPRIINYDSPEIANKLLEKALQINVLDESDPHSMVVDSPTKILYNETSNYEC